MTEAEIAEGREKVLKRVEGRFRARSDAEAWFETVPVPGFGIRTARQLVEDGHADWVVQAIDAIEAGVHA